MCVSLIDAIQTQLKLHNIQGWLLYDLHGSNPLALSVMHIPCNTLMTRRSFYWIPQMGSPVKIVHRVEADNLDHLPGEKRPYLGWGEMHEHLKEILLGSQIVAMEYSPHQAIPTLCKVDAGLVDLIRSFGVNVVSSAPFLQFFTCVWDEEQYALHKEAAQILDNTAEKTWEWLGRAVKMGKSVSEYDVQQFILSELKMAKCITEGMPICGVNQNSAYPHYVPVQKQSIIIREQDLVLIDLWCKRDLPRAVFADITRVGIVASTPTPKQQTIFDIVRKAQKAGINQIKWHMHNNLDITGAEVDLEVRRIIREAGYASYFTHRTGHNIHTDCHGPGTNLDALETEDSRLLIPKTCCSIEPGIYLHGEFGIRLENNLYIHANGKVEVTSPLQEKFVSIE